MDLCYSHVFSVLINILYLYTGQSHTSAYNSSISPPDMDGIRRIKTPHKGKQFQTRADLVHDYEATIRSINQNHESLGISMLPDRWRAIHLGNGNYIDP